MRRKIRIFISVGILLLILLVTISFAPFLPVIGGVVAAGRIEKYVHNVYDVENIGWYAKYNPVSSSYYMILRKTSGESVEISCDGEGNIFDAERCENILAELGLEKQFARQNDRDQRQFGYLTCCWRFDSSEVAFITLCVGIRECIEPFPETNEAMLEKMAERVKIYYDLLTEEGKDALSQAYISYQHYAEERENSQNYDNYVYAICLDMKDGVEPIEDKVFLSDVIITKK